MERRKQRQDSAVGPARHRPTWVVLGAVVVRAAHQVCAAVYLSCFLLPGIAGPPVWYLAGAAVSGALLVFTEWLRHPLLFRETAGLATLVKLVILGAAYHHYVPAAAAVAGAFVAASVAAHLPKQLRHRLLI